MASTLLRAARSASLAPRAAAAAATRAAGMASRSPRASGVAAAAARLYSAFPLKSFPTRDDGYTKPRDNGLSRTFSSADDAHLSDDDGIIPMDKDLESEEAVWALYDRWCKAFNKQRDHAEMARRFKIFKHHAQHVHAHNTYVPEDPEEAAIYCRKRRQLELLLSKGEDISHIDDQYVPLELYLNADGSDPFLSEYDKDLLKQIEEREAHGAVKDDTVESFA